MKPVIYAIKNSGRAGTIARAMQEGFQRHGIPSTIKAHWNGQVEGDLAVAYGWAHEPTFSAYRAAGGTFVYWDLGYWNRTPHRGGKGGRREGHHRLAVGSWDTADTMRRGCPPDRWLAAQALYRLKLRPYAERGNRIIVAGMSGKAAGTHGFKAGQWEEETTMTLDLLTDETLEVVYRPKPVDGDGSTPIEVDLQTAALLVTHHSNTAVDALLAGVPSYARKGVGKLWSAPSLEDAVAGRSPRPTDLERHALLADIAYAQWSPAEMRSGVAWEHIRGLV